MSACLVFSVTLFGFVSNCCRREISLLSKCSAFCIPLCSFYFIIIKDAFHENSLQLYCTCWVNEPYGRSSCTPNFSFIGQTDVLKKRYIKLNC